jgi:hypothetical protein
MSPTKGAATKASKRAAQKKSPRKPAKRAAATKASKRAAPKKSPRKPAKHAAATPKAATKPATTKASGERSAKKAAARPATMAFAARSGVGGKGEGAAAIRAWIDAIAPEHQDLARRFDDLVGSAVPDVRRAVKWNSAFYGVAGQGWITTLASFKQHMSIGFFTGTRLVPQPPLGDSGNMRRVQLRSPEDFDEAQLRSWLEQASALPGWGKVS